MERKTDIKNGPAAAAFVAAGIGALALGVITTLSEANATISNALNLYNPTGPLTGKIIFEVLVWAIAWVVLDSLWGDRQVNFKFAFAATLILIALGFLGTFPIFFNVVAGK